MNFEGIDNTTLRARADLDAIKRNGNIAKSLDIMDSMQRIVRDSNALGCQASEASDLYMDAEDYYRDMMEDEMEDV